MIRFWFYWLISSENSSQMWESSDESLFALKVL